MQSPSFFRLSTKAPAAVMQQIHENLVLAPVLSVPTVGPCFVKSRYVNSMTSNHLPLHLIAPPPNQNDTMQRSAHIALTQLRQRPTLDILGLRPHPRHGKRQPPRRTNALPTARLGLEHLRCTRRSGHEARRVVADAARARQQLEVRLLDLDVEQHERVQAERGVVAQAVVERRGFPRRCEEHHRCRCSEVVQREPRHTDCVEDRRVVDVARCDSRGVRCAAEREVTVCSCAV